MRVGTLITLLALSLALPSLADACPKRTKRSHAEADGERAGGEEHRERRQHKKKKRHRKHHTERTPTLRELEVALTTADIDVVNQWQDPTGQRWIASSPATSCATLDPLALRALLGTAAVSCDDVATPSRVTIVLPRQLLEGNTDWFRNGRSPAAMLPAGVPVDVVAYDIRSDSFLSVTYPDASKLAVDYDGLRADFQASVLPSSLREHPWRESPNVLHWITSGLIEWRELEQGQVVVFFAPTEDTPVGIANVEHALGVLPPHAQYTVISTSNDGSQTDVARLSTITNAGYATSSTDSSRVANLINNRVLLTVEFAPGTPSTMAKQPSADRPTTCQRRGERGIAPWFVVGLVLWYTIGLKIAIFMMIRRRGQNGDKQ